METSAQPFLKIVEQDKESAHINAEKLNRADTKMMEPTGKHRGLMLGRVALSIMRKVSKEASSTLVIPTIFPPGPSTISGMD